MSVMASIDLKLVSRSNTILSANNVINRMIEGGWNINKNDKICYLPIGDDDLYEWQEKEMMNDEFYHIIEQKQDLNEVIGIELYWNNSDIGLSTLIFGNSDISFNLSINRVKLESNKLDITDVNWYLEKIMFCFSDDILVQKVVFSQD